MTPAFKTAVDELKQHAARFATGELSPVGYRDLREPALGRALVAMALELGVTLQQPLYVDARGEYSIVAVKPGQDPRYGCAPFGEAFAKALTAHRARMGIQAGIVDPSSGWCRLFHMEAEKMVLAHAAAAEPT